MSAGVFAMRRLSRRPWPFVLVLAGAAAGLCLSPGRGGTAEKPKAAANADIPFTLPPGFVAERVAGPPLVGHPMMGCFDERGRLFVAEAAGQNLPFPELMKKLPNFVRRLEDANGD